MNSRTDMARKRAEKMNPTLVKTEDGGSGGGSSSGGASSAPAVDKEDAEFTTTHEDDDPDRFAAFGRYFITMIRIRNFVLLHNFFVY